MASPPTPRRHDRHIRVGDAEREQALGSLREHYAQGRIDASELDERLSAALLARTRGDLARLFSDLPGDRWPPRARPPARHPMRLATRLLGGATVATLVIGVVVAVALIVAMLVWAVAVGGFLWLLFWWWLLARGWGRACGGRRSGASWQGHGQLRSRMPG